VKERGETSGTSKPSGPVYVEVVRIYQTEYATSSPTPGTQQAQAQTQTQHQEQAQTQQAGAPSPTDILEKRSSLLQSTLESWYAKQDYIITLSGLIPKMRALFGVEPVYSNVILPDMKRAIDVYATLDLYKKILSLAVLETQLMATLALDQLNKQYSELMKASPEASLVKGYEAQIRAISEDVKALTALYNEIAKTQLPQPGDEKALATVVSQFSTWADTVYKYRSKYKEMRTNIDALIGLMKASISEKKDPSLEKLNQALTLLQDKNKLKDMLARFFLLMDYTRSETYDMYMNTYRSSIESLIKVINDQATYIDFWNALLFVHVLMEMEAKGWLNYKEQLAPKLQGKYGREASSMLQSSLTQKYKDKLSAIEKGQVPPREAAPDVVFAEWVGKIDPFRYIADYVYNSLKGVFGDTGAKMASSAAVWSIGTLMGAIAAPVATVLGIVAVTDAVADIGSRLQNPIDREIFMKYVSEHWAEILASIAVGVVAAVATGYVASKIKPYVVDKFADFIGRFSPSFAAKIRSHFGLVKGKPIYESDTTIVRIDLENKKIYIYNKATGEVKNIATLKIPRNLEQYFDDPELRLSVSMIVGNLSEEQAVSFLSLLDKIAEKLGASGLRETVKLYLDKLNAGQLKSGVGVYLSGEAGITVDYDGVTIFDPNTKRLIVISKTSPQGEKFYPLLEISRQDPVAFNIYYLAKVYNIKPETLLEKLSPYLNAIKEGGKPVGDVVVGDLKFSFKGDKLNILLPDIGKPIQLDLRGFNPNSLLGLVLTGKEFANTYGEAMHSLLLDTMAFGYKLLSPQVPDILVNIGGGVVPVIDFSKVLPKPIYTSGSMVVTENGVVYVSNQLLEEGINVNTISTINVAKNFLKTRFTQDTLITIDLTDKTIQYLSLAVSQGYEGESAVAQAIAIAKKIGDVAAQSELLKLQLAISLVRQNLASIPLMYKGSGGGVAGVVADGALVGAIESIVQQLQQGNTQQAQILLQQALEKSGLSSATARQLAQSIIQSMIQAFAAEQQPQKTPATTAPTTTPRQVTIQVYSIVTEKKKVLVPVEEYAPEEALTTEKAIGRVVLRPQYTTIPQAKPVAIPVEEYETEEVEVGETTRGRAVIEPKIIVVRRTPTITIPYKEYYTEEFETRDTARGTVYPVEAPLTVPVVIPLEVNVEEGETAPTPPTPTPPTPAPMPMPMFPPGSLPPTPSTPTPTKPPPRGRRQLEELEI